MRQNKRRYRWCVKLVNPPLLIIVLLRDYSSSAILVWAIKIYVLRFLTDSFVRKKFKPKTLNYFNYPTTATFYRLLKRRIKLSVTYFISILFTFLHLAHTTKTYTPMSHLNNLLLPQFIRIPDLNTHKVGYISILRSFASLKYVRSKFKITFYIQISILFPSFWI